MSSEAHNGEKLSTAPEPLTIEAKEFMFKLFDGGVVGTKEFRNWLAKVDPAFGAVRDPDVDNEIDRVARDQQQRSQERLLDRLPPEDVDKN